jgi:hypothetical protein
VRAILLGAFVLALALPAVAAAPAIPVRVRILKADKTPPPAVDPRLEDLRPQLANLAYQKWDEVDRRELPMEFGKDVDVSLPDGSKLTLRVLSSSKDNVTFKVGLAAHKTQSSLTISKDQRIVYQVVHEKNGVAYFASIRPWPAP